MIHIVVLQLENNCFFIGKTYDIIFNIDKYNRNCNAFTKNINQLNYMNLNKIVMNMI